MRLALHIFKYDARALRFEAAASLLLTLLLAALHAWPLSGPDSAHPELFAHTGVIQVLVVVAWVLLAIRAIQLHPLQGEDEDWLTRPIPRSALVLAKAIFLAVFIVLPVAVAATVMLLARGLGPLSNPAGFLFYLAAFALVVVSPAAAIGALTRKLPAAVLTALACAFVLGVADELAPSGAEFHPMLAWVPFSAALAVLAASALAVLAIQYRARRTAAARLLGAAALAGFFLISARPSWDAAFAVQQWARPADAGAAPARAALDLSWIPVQNAPSGTIAFTLAMQPQNPAHRVRILRIEGAFDGAPARLAPPHLQGRENMRVLYAAHGPTPLNNSTAFTGRVWYELLALTGQSATSPGSNGGFQAPPGPCRLLAELDPGRLIVPALVCSSAFRAPLETTFWLDDARPASFRSNGTEQASPWPAGLGLPVDTSVTALSESPSSSLRGADLARTRIHAQTWRPAGFFAHSLRVQLPPPSVR